MTPADRGRRKRRGEDPDQGQKTLSSPIRRNAVCSRGGRARPPMETLTMATDLLALWLPIVVSGVVLFILSSIFWTLAPHHKKDIACLPQQDEVLDALRKLDIPQGSYMFPNCEDPKEYKTERFKALYDTGPWGTLNLFPAKPSMVRNMGLTFLYFLVVSIVIAYIAGASRTPGAEFGAVFQLVATGGVLVYVLGGMMNGLWFGKRLRFFVTDAIDGLVYALATGLIFGLLWPGA